MPEQISFAPMFLDGSDSQSNYPVNEILVGDPYDGYDSEQTLYSPDGEVDDDTDVEDDILQHYERE